MDSSRNHGGSNMGGSNVDIEGAAEAAYESIFTEKPDRPKAPHETWATLPEFYRNQYRRIARAVIDHVMPGPDLFSQEGE